MNRAATEIGARRVKEPPPRLRDGIDLSRVGLNQDEGMLASRIDGRTSVEELVLVLGKPREEVERLLTRLVKAGVVLLDASKTEAAPKPKPIADDGKADYGRYIFPIAPMQEVCDLNEDERKRILWFHEHLDQWTHYEVLQVGRRAEVKDVKRAYFSRSKEWHPDRFRRENLGSFKRMLDTIFRRIQEANAVLTDPIKRSVYDAESVHTANEEEIAEVLDTQRREDRERRRAEEAEERRIRHNPMLRRINQAQEFYQEALALQEKGDFLDALRAAQSAQAFDPRRDEYTRLVEQLKLEAGELRIGPMMKRGLAQESLTNWQEAITAFSEAVRLAPENGPARLRLAFNLVMGSRDPQEANPHAQKAVALLPDDPEAHFVLGLCYERAGMEKAAVRALSRAVELKPNYAEAKKRLKKLKWGF